MFFFVCLFTYLFFFCEKSFDVTLSVLNVTSRVLHFDAERHRTRTGSRDVAHCFPGGGMPPDLGTDADACVSVLSHALLSSCYHPFCPPTQTQARRRGGGGGGGSLEPLF